VKAEARLRLGGPAAQQNTVGYDGLKPTLKSVSQDVFSAKKNTRPECDNFEKRLHKKCSTLFHTAR